MKIDIFNENCNTLRKKFFPKWKSLVRKNLPYDYNITDEEIVSELTIRCIELTKNFKSGFFPCYCERYGHIVEEVVKRMWEEYRKLDHSLIADAYDEYENGEDYTETPNVVVIDTSYTYVDDRKRKIRKLTAVYEAAIRLDKDTEGYYRYAEIIDDMRMGMSMDEIADEFGTYKMDISRRFTAIKNVVDKENGYEQ